MPILYIFGKKLVHYNDCRCPVGWWVLGSRSCLWNAKDNCASLYQIHTYIEMLVALQASLDDGEISCLITVKLHDPHSYLTSPATPLFVLQLFQANNTENTNAIHIAGLLWGESTTGGFTSQRASNAEKISTPWFHHGRLFCLYSITRVWEAPCFIWGLLCWP